MPLLHTPVPCGKRCSSGRLGVGQNLVHAEVPGDYDEQRVVGGAAKDSFRTVRGGGGAVKVS